MKRKCYILKHNGFTESIICDNVFLTEESVKSYLKNEYFKNMFIECDSEIEFDYDSEEITFYDKYMDDYSKLYFELFDIIE